MLNYKKNKKNCFFVTPIGDANTSIREKTDTLISDVLEPALGERYNIIVAHQIYQTGNINEDIIKHIKDDDLLIVNLTGLNGNVLFELGVRFSIGKPFILIAEEGTKLPFDIAFERTTFYVPNESGYNKLKNKLKLFESKITDKNKFKIYEGRWIEIILNFPERPIAICNLKCSDTFELVGHNYDFNDRNKDVFFQSNLIIDSFEKRDSFYYITHPTLIKNTTGFGKINFLKIGTNDLNIAEGYFIDILSSGNEIDAIRQTKMIKCDNKFKKAIGLEGKNISKISNYELLCYSADFLKKNYNVEVKI